MAQDEGLMLDLRGGEAKLQAVWELFEEVVTRYPEIFPQRLVDNDLFLNVYG